MKQLDTQQILLWLKQPNHWLPIAHWGVWVIALFWLAKTLWVWVEVFLPASLPTAAPELPVARSGQASEGFSVDALVSRHLLGNVTKQPETKTVVAENVQETRLNLKLRGIYAVEDALRANAIIEDDRGKQAVYFINDKLNVSGQVFLRQVQENRVVLESNGRRESLTLKELAPDGVFVESSDDSSRGDGDDESGGLREVGELQEQPDTRVIDHTDDERLTDKLNEYREKLKENPLSFSEVINGRPELRDGELVGFRISPGKDRRLFTQLGLRRDDVVTAINGVPLNSMEEAMGLFSELDNFDNVEVAIQRGSENLSLMLDLNQQEDKDAGTHR